MMVRLNRQINMEIIQFYASTSESKAEELDKFITITEAVALPERYFFLNGDFKANVAKQLNEAEVHFQSMKEET